MAVQFKVEEHLADVEAFKRELEPIKDKRGMLLQALHFAQNRFGHIPPPIQEIISKTLKIPMSTIYGVITFYSRYTLEPKGKCDVSICMGTACYIQGAAELLEEAETELGVKMGETRDDGIFSISATRCVGACGLAPIVSVNEEVYSRMNLKKMKALLKELKQTYEEAEENDA